MNNTVKNIAIWALIAFLVFLIIDFYQSNQTSTRTTAVPYSQFLQDVKNGNVSQVEIRGNNITGLLNNGAKFATYSPNDLSLIDKLEKNSVEIIAKPVDRGLDFLYEANAVW